MFELKTATFVRKILAKTNDFPAVFDVYIEIVSDQWCLNTRFGNRKNLIKPKARTNYGIEAFELISLPLSKFINPEIKGSNSLCIYLKKLLNWKFIHKQTPYLIPRGIVRSQFVLYKNK